MPHPAAGYHSPLGGSWKEGQSKCRSFFWCRLGWIKTSRVFILSNCKVNTTLGVCPVFLVTLGMVLSTHVLGKDGSGASPSHSLCSAGCHFWQWEEGECDCCSALSPFYSLELPGIEVWGGFQIQLSLQGRAKREMLRLLFLTHWAERALKRFSGAPFPKSLCSRGKRCIFKSTGRQRACSE